MHYGQTNAYWLSYYRFGERLGLVLTANSQRGLTLWDRLSRSCGWWSPRNGIALMCDRPERQLLDDRGRVHCDDGPAIKFRDGYALWAVHGTRVTQKIVEQPTTLTKEEIKAEKNAEVRRIMRERFGEGRYLQETGAKVVDVDFEGARKGAAPRVLMVDDEGGKFMAVTDGSTKRVYYLAVPPEVTTCKQGHEALCGFDESRVLVKS